MNLKAYAWDDEDYGESYLVWATTPGKAKALLAAEHDIKFTEIRVYRVPWADKCGCIVQTVGHVFRMIQQQF